MRSLITGFGLLALTAAPVLAADLPVKARPMAPAAIVAYNWSGCYIGGNVGVGFLRDEQTRIGTVGGVAVLSNDFGSGSHTNIIGGGQIGCDYQFASNWVIGLQGMFDAAGFSGRHVSPIEEDETFRSRTHWFATLTGRLGFLATPNLLLYGKAGWGWV